jgi:hypothetical protein
MGSEARFGAFWFDVLGSGGGPVPDEQKVI